MSNRVIKDKIWSSPSLAKMTKDAQLHWPRWLLMADDWGCFNSDADIIKGVVYPKMKVTVKDIEKLKHEYYINGKLFLWMDGDREWGFFTSWDGHQFCNKTHLDDDGKQNRHKRKTPEPPKELFEEYVKNQWDKEKLERLRADADKYRIPIPNLNPIPKPYIVGFDKFWTAYPNKKSKGEAKKAWDKIKPDELLLETILSTIEKAKTSKQWTDDNGQYIPHPTTWLNREGWEDEYIEGGQDGEYDIYNKPNG